MSSFNMIHSSSWLERMAEFFPKFE
jgi:hypothetical protein